MRLIASIRTRCRAPEEGQGLAEYALILSLLVVVCAAALGTFGTKLANWSVWNLPV